MALWVETLELKSYETQTTILPGKKIIYTTITLCIARYYDDWYLTKGLRLCISYFQEKCKGKADPVLHTYGVWGCRCGKYSFGFKLSFFSIIINSTLCIILHCNSINSDPFETVRMFHGKCTSACPTDLHSHKRSTSGKG